MLDGALRAVFLALANSQAVKRSASRYGMRDPGGFARRFVGGESIGEAIATARALAEQGFAHTMNHLGEHVRTLDAAEEAARDYLDTIAQLSRAGLPCQISVKLSQLGLEIDRQSCADRLRTIADSAQGHDGFVRIDMEGSSLVEDTLRIFSELWAEGRRSLGVVLQAYLHRSPSDLRRMVELGARVRLVKGAYKERPDIAYQQKTDVDRAFVALARILLEEGSAPAFATHDPRMVTTVCRLASERGLGANLFEFEVLYGVRRDLQTSLLAQGHRVRVYLPFGKDWFPYFMRRLAERPANVWFVLKSILYEQKGL